MTAGPQRPSWPHPRWSRPHRSAVLFTIFRAEPFKRCPRQLVPTAHHRVACPSLCWACRSVGYQCAERGGGAPQTLQTPSEPTWMDLQPLRQAKGGTGDLGPWGQRSQEHSMSHL